MDRRALLVEEQLDHDARHGVGAPPDLIDLVVAQVRGLVAEQLATPIDRDSSVGSSAGKISSIATRSTIGHQLLWVFALRTSRDLPRRPGQMR